MRVHSGRDPADPWLVLAHGAGAGHEHPWMQQVAAGLVARGLHVVTFDFPYMAAGRSLPDKAPVLEAAFAEVWQEVAGRAATASDRPPILVAGGKSMGGRIASQAAARGLFTPVPAGLIFFGYPLHPPNKPESRRDWHLPDVPCPMRFVHGTRDPFGSPEELTALVAGLPRAVLDLVPGGDHSLLRGRAGGTIDLRLAEPLDRAARWVRTLATLPSA